MKKYLSFILEGKIDDIKEKYQGKIEDDILNYFVNVTIDKLNSKSVFLEKMINFYIDNKDNEKYDKVKLNKFIFDLVYLFNSRKKELEIKDITQIKELDKLKTILSNFETPENSHIYLDGEEYIIFSPYDFNEAHKYGDHTWCINRNPKYFHDINYKAYQGGVIQCINKIDANKNIAVVIENIDDFWSYYEQPEKFMLVTLWDSNDDNFFKGEIIDMIDDEHGKLKKYSAIDEIIGVLEEIEENGLDHEAFYGLSWVDLFYNFSCSIEDALDFIYENDLYDEDIIYEIISGLNEDFLKKILNYLSKLGIYHHDISDVDIQDNIDNIIHTLSLSLMPDEYLKKFNLDYKGANIPISKWEFIVKNISDKDIIKIFKDNDLKLQYQKDGGSDLTKQLKMFESQNNRYDIIVNTLINLPDHMSYKILLDIVDKFYLNDHVDISNFISHYLDFEKIEHWKWFYNRTSGYW